MLYIVATPIGNLHDISYRAVEILKEVDQIAAEDTRYSKQLLNHLNIKKQICSLHEHNEHIQINKMINNLLSGKKIAIISDAGTPLISDPGFKLVRAAHENNIKVIPIPGPCALITALCSSGLPTDRFTFEGFLPAKVNPRKEYLNKLISEHRTMIFYEAPHRLCSSLKSMLEIFGANRKAVLARELTKTFETIKYSNLQELIDFVSNDLNQQKGEIVILVEGKNKEINSKENHISEQAKNILQILLKELSLKQSVDLAVKITDESKKLLYSYALELKEV